MVKEFSQNQLLEKGQCHSKVETSKYLKKRRYKYIAYICKSFFKKIHKNGEFSFGGSCQ